MSGSIYVLLWSTGAVKVGRSDKPAQRIKQHEQSAAGFGVTLTASHVVPCADSHHAERLLIEWAGAQAVQVVGREWNLGLDFDAACDFARSVASEVPAVSSTGEPMTTAAVHRYFGGVNATAKALGIAQPSVSNWGERPPVLRQLQIERLTNGLLRADHECDPYRVAPVTA